MTTDTDTLVARLRCITTNGCNPYSACHDAAARIEALEAELARLRYEINEASDPDFLFGAMDNVSDMDVSVSQFADAASRAIRAALASHAARLEDRDYGC